MRPPHILIKVETKSCALVTGYGARDLIMKVTKRSPVWATVSRGWVIQPSIIRDLVAVIERKGWDCTIVGETVADPGIVSTLGRHLPEPEPEPEPESALW